MDSDNEHRLVDRPVTPISIARHSELERRLGRRTERGFELADGDTERLGRRNEDSATTRATQVRANGEAVPFEWTVSYVFQ